MSAEHELAAIARELRRIRLVLERLSPPPEKKPGDGTGRRVVVLR